MKIENISVKEIKPYKKNAKKHPEEQVQHIANSIKEFGFRQPLVIDKDNVVVIGHGRLLAAKKLGLTEVPCIRADDLTEEQIKALRLADNKTNESEWDFDFLNVELDDIVDIDMEQFGFEISLDDEPAEVVEDEVPEEVETRCKLGDLWQLGEHRLICGDSTDVNVIDKLMDGVKADISFTSPPYNAGKSEKLSGNTHTVDSKYMNSDDNLSDWKELVSATTENMILNSKWTFVNLQMLSGNKLKLVEWLYDFHEQLCDISIWYKTSTAPAMAENVMNSQFEFIFIFSKENNSRAIGTRKFRGTVSNVYTGSPQRNNEYSEIHAATFPIEFPSYFIDTFTNKKDSILDVFGGTGTTMIACEQLDRKCYMCELDEHYCDVIIQRWEDFTGKKAVLLNGE